MGAGSNVTVCVYYTLVQRIRCNTQIQTLRCVRVTGKGSLYNHNKPPMIGTKNKMLACFSTDETCLRPVISNAFEFYRVIQTCLIHKRIYPI